MMGPAAEIVCLFVNIKCVVSDGLYSTVPVQYCTCKCPNGMFKLKFKTKLLHTAVLTRGVCPQRNVIKLHQRFDFAP